MGNAILRGQTGGASPTVISQKKLTLLADVTIYSARTSVDFTGLNVGADTELLLVADVNNTSASGSDYSIFINGNNTGTNYYRQNINATSTTINVGRSNDCNLIYTNANTKVQANVNLKLTNNNYYTIQSNMVREYGGGAVCITSNFGTSTFTATSITQLTITATAFNAIGIGSRFQLYSLNTGGEKTWVTS